MNEKQISFDMKIQYNKQKKDKNGCIPFREGSIENIPNLELYIDDSINKQITEGCKAVLRASMSPKNPYRFGEMGLLLSVLNIDSEGNKLPIIHEWFKGEYHNITTDGRYKNIVDKRLIHDLVMIHNHPNNSRLSIKDLKSFSYSPALACIIAVGNTSNIFAALKNDENKSSEIHKFIDTYVKHKGNEKDVVDYIMNNQEQFGVEFYHFNRKHR